MLPSFEPTSNAISQVLLMADTTWANNKLDSYRRANQNLWLYYSYVSEKVEKISTGGQETVYRVKDIIPSSKLAKYGNYEYDECREKLYSPNNETFDFSDIDIYTEKWVESWMLPEVADHCRKLTSNSAENPNAKPQMAKAHREQLKMYPIEQYTILAKEEKQMEEKIKSQEVADLWKESMYDMTDAKELLNVSIPEFFCKTPVTYPIKSSVFPIYYFPSFYDSSYDRELYPYSENIIEEVETRVNQEVNNRNNFQVTRKYNKRKSKHEIKTIPYSSMNRATSVERKSAPVLQYSQIRQHFRSAYQQSGSNNFNTLHIVQDSGQPEMFSENNDCTSFLTNLICDDDNSSEINKICVSGTHAPPVFNSVQTNHEIQMNWLAKMYPSRWSEIDALKYLTNECSAVETSMNIIRGRKMHDVGTNASENPTKFSQSISQYSGSYIESNSLTSLYRDVTTTLKCYDDILLPPPAPPLSPLEAEKVFEDLEREALEQYQQSDENIIHQESSDDSITKIYKKLEREAVEQYEFSNGSNNSEDSTKIKSFLTGDISQRRDRYPNISKTQSGTDFLQPQI